MRSSRKHPSSKRLLLLYALLVLIGIVAAFADAQENLGKGRITGDVFDENRTPLEGVLIEVQGLKGGAKLEGTTDKKGHFAVTGMGGGIWKITASKSGYTPVSKEENIKQLSINPPMTFVLKKITGFAAFLADEEAKKLFDLGNSLVKEEKYDEALKVFEDFSVKYPEVFEVQLNVGTCHFKKGDLEKAETAYKLVLDKVILAFGDYKKGGQTSTRAFSGLGEVYLQKEDFDSAQIFFGQALEVSPNDEIAAYNVGEIFFSHQKTDEAVRYLELAIQIKKTWPKPYMKLGYVYLNKGDFDKSLQYFGEFIKMDPENPEASNIKNMMATIEKMKKGL